MHSIWRPPFLHTEAHEAHGEAHREAHGEEERKVTWLELFYDLVYVATIIQMGNMLSHDISWLGFLKFIALFIPYGGRGPGSPSI